jgi:hypothetical protein
LHPNRGARKTSCNKVGGYMRGEKKRENKGKQGKTRENGGGSEPTEGPEEEPPEVPEEPSGAGDVRLVRAPLRWVPGNRAWLGRRKRRFSVPHHY